MNEQEQDRLIEGLSQALTKAITTALRDLVRGVSGATEGASTIALPTGGKADSAAGSQFNPESYTSEPTTESGADRSSIAHGFTEYAYAPPSAYFDDLPEVPPRPVMPPLTLPTAPISAGEIPSPSPQSPLDTHSRLDIKRGFSTDDPTGRIVFAREQDAQANRYDQTTDLLYEAMVKQSRVDRDYRQRQYDLTQRILQDSNNDYRRIDDLERRHECSRENITDCNI